VPSDTVTVDARLPLERPSWRRGAGLLLLFLALTAFFTWPQVTMMRHGLVAHQDPLFSAWRLGWVSHALFTDPANLFEGNILYPAHRTLAFSDAMLLQGLIAAPFIRLGASPLLMVNVLWFLSMIASAGGMYLLARRLTGSTLGAIVAAMIFTFAPYRTEHNMHLELNWAQWIPLTLWALHRALTEDRFWPGVLAGVFVVLQLLSCIYYAHNLLLLLPLFGVASLIVYWGKYSWRPLVGFAVGGALFALAYAAQAKQAQAQTQPTQQVPPLPPAPKPTQLAPKKKGETGAPFGPPSGVNMMPGPDGGLWVQAPDGQFVRISREQLAPVNQFANRVMQSPAFRRVA